MKKKTNTANTNTNQNPSKNPTLISDALFVFLAGVYIISRPLLTSPAIIDIAVGASLILMAVKLFIIGRRK